VESYRLNLIVGVNQFQGYDSFSWSFQQSYFTPSFLACDQACLDRDFKGLFQPKPFCDYVTPRRVLQSMGGRDQRGDKRKSAGRRFFMLRKKRKMSEW